jgi:hypothetical protein
VQPVAVERSCTRYFAALPECGVPNIGISVRFAMYPTVQSLRHRDGSWSAEFPCATHIRVAFEQRERPNARQHLFEVPAAAATHAARAGCFPARGQRPLPARATGERLPLPAANALRGKATSLPGEVRSASTNPTGYSFRTRSLIGPPRKSPERRRPSLPRKSTRAGITRLRRGPSAASPRLSRTATMRVAI